MFLFFLRFKMQYPKFFYWKLKNFLISQLNINVNTFDVKTSMNYVAEPLTLVSMQTS